MTDEAAEPRAAEATDRGSSAYSPTAAPAPSTPEPDAPTGDRPADEQRQDPPPAAGPDPTAAAAPPPPGPPPPPPWGYDPPTGPPPPPPPGGTGFTSRYGLVRPRQGRYLAGVCAAIGRATNTDPVLWRVLLAVLGFFGGIGILVYVAAWLIIPGEGDTASPVESMLGRGRSSMSPITVIILSILVAVSFGFIVTDAFRAVLLGAAILIGGALLLNRNANRAEPPGATGSGGPPPPAAAPPGQPGPAPFTPSAPTIGFPAASYPAAAYSPPAYSAPGAPYSAPAAASPPAARSYEPGYPAAYPPPPPAPAYAARAGTSAPPYPGGGADPAPASAEPPTQPLPAWSSPSSAMTAPPAGGYRPPFAPHGPYAGTGPYPPGGAPAPRPAKPPKPPRERSALGAATFSLIFLAIGAVAILDLANVVSVPTSGYFAAALTTIALGLLVGTWFGRARWLIALGLAAAAALGIATLTESVTRIKAPDGPVTWSPASYGVLADRYENRFGDSTLDLTDVDFAGRDTDVAVSVNFGSLTVIVPPNVDVTAISQVNAGDARVFGERWSGFRQGARTATDLGADGTGGGTLRLTLDVNAGNLEVTR